MARLGQIISYIENTLAALALGIATILTIINVILRTFFSYSIFWGEEAVIYLIIFSVFIGTSIALRYNEHVGVDVVSFLFKERGKWVLAMLGALLLVIYCGAFGMLAWKMITNPAVHTSVSPALKIPLWIVQLSVPIGLTLLFLRAAELLYRQARYKQGFPEEEAGHVKDGGI